MSDLHNKPGENMEGLPSYQDLENAVLNGATAIHCLTAERNQLRGRVEAQEAELETLRATNEHLRRQRQLFEIRRLLREPAATHRAIHAGC